MHDDLKQRLRDEVDSELGSRPPRDLADVLARGHSKRLALRLATTVSMVLLGTAFVAGGLWIAGPRSLSTERGSMQPADDNRSPSQPTPSEAWTGPCADSQDGPPPRVCRGPLEEGTYTSQRFEPALTFTVPAGWNNPWDTRRSFDLWTPGWSDGWQDPADPGIYMFDHAGLSLSRDVRPDESCPDGVDAAAGMSALELATWVGAHPGIAANAPSSVEVGELSGYQLDVSIAHAWKSCRIEEGQGPPSVPLFDQLGLIDHPGYAKMRVILLDLPDGGNVLIAIDGKQVGAAMPVVHSFEFDLS